MKKSILSLIIILAVMAGGCKKGGSWFKKEKSLQERQLEQKHIDDSIKAVEEQERAQREAQAIQDSIKNAADKAALAAAGFKYYVITGAFMEASNADRYKKKMDNMGFASEIIAGPYGYNLVSVSGTNDKSEAISVMNTMKNSVTEKAWVYVKK